MWRAGLSRTVKEVRFILKQAPEHHGVWNFVYNKLPEIKMMNQETFFAIKELSEEYTSPSACYLIFDDENHTEEEILTSGLTSSQFESKLKETVTAAATKLTFWTPENNTDREVPVSVVEAQKYVKYMDDGF